MRPTNPQDIAAALAFLAEQGVDTGWIPPNRTLGWMKSTGVSTKTATPYDIHAITDMLAEWLKDRNLAVHRCEGHDGFVWVMYETEYGWLGQDDTTTDLNCNDNRLAAHLAACREVGG